MTRINADLDPIKLTDQHLMAEYREMPMVISSLRRSLRTQSVDKVLKKIPKEFTLNSGHVLFFYDKLGFLQYRYEKLRKELKNRNFNIDDSRKLDFNGIPMRFINFWKSDERAEQIILERIRQKINMKPSWYKYYSKPLKENTNDII